jgi:hypothetical protein
MISNEAISAHFVSSGEIWHFEKLTQRIGPAVDTYGSEVRTFYRAPLFSRGSKTRCWQTACLSTFGRSRIVTNIRDACLALQRTSYRSVAVSFRFAIIGLATSCLSLLWIVSSAPR